MSFNITPVASGYQEIHPYSAMNFDSVKINTSLIMMKEWDISLDKKQSGIKMIGGNDHQRQQVHVLNEAHLQETMFCRQFFHTFPMFGTTENYVGISSVVTGRPK